VLEKEIALAFLQINKKRSSFIILKPKKITASKFCFWDGYPIVTYNASEKTRTSNAGIWYQSLYSNHQGQFSQGTWRI